MADDSDLDSDFNDDDGLDLEESESSSLHTVGDSASSLLAKDLERKRIQAEIEAFLAAGGQIQCVGANVIGDPPKKPEASYGSRPI